MERTRFLEEGCFLQLVHATKTCPVVKKLIKRHLILVFFTIFDIFNEDNDRSYCHQGKLINFVTLL